MGKALVFAPLGVQSPSFLLTEPSHCRSVAKKATSINAWRLLWGELGSRSSLEQVLELLGTVWDASVSLFWELENAIRDSKLSGNLAHELLPLPGPAATLLLSAHPCSPERSRRKTAALWCGSLQSRKRSTIFFLLWLDGTVCQGFLPCSTFPSRRILP